MKHLVLLGGGPGHLRVLHELAAAPLPGVQVTLVAPHGRHVAPEMVAGWITGRHDTEACTVPLAPLATKARAALIDSEPLALDASTRQVVLANGHTLHYDALSIDMPAVPDRDAIPGARENALFLRPSDQFLRLWGALVALADEQALSVVVVGGDIPAIELALAVHLRLGKRARVALVTGGGPPAGDRPAAFQRRVRQVLKRGQVTIFEDRCDALFGNQMLLGHGMRLACDAPLMAQPAGAPRWVPDSGLARGAGGLLDVGPTAQSTSHPEVFVVGELAVSTDREPPAQAWVPLRDRSPLGLNLRRFLAGGALVSRAAPQRGLWLLDAGQGRALAGWGALAVEGRWVGWLKERAERRRVAEACADGPRGVPPSEAAVVAAPPVPGADETQSGR
jgi:NADH dehydrogenase FAD-containing subunit